MSKEEIKKIIINYLLPYHPKTIGLFGSFVRNEMRPDSDIDILIEQPTGMSLFDLVHLEEELSKAIGRKVDIVTESVLNNSYMRESIQEDLQIIFQ